MVSRIILFRKTSINTMSVFQFRKMFFYYWYSIQGRQCGTYNAALVYYDIMHRYILSIIELQFVSEHQYLQRYNSN